MYVVFWWGKQKKDVCSVLVGKPEERRHLEDLSVHWSIILKWIVKK
jgi:hypothetical protein